MTTTMTTTAARTKAQEDKGEEADMGQSREELQLQALPRDALLRLLRLPMYI